MNLENANTEPFYRLLRFHEGFNRSIKASASAVSHAQSAVASSANKKRFLSALIKASGEPRGDSHEWPEPERELENAWRLFSEMAIVRVDSAFEDFVTGIDGEHSRNRSRLGLTIDPTPQTQDTDSKIVRICSKLGFHTCALDGYLPVWDLFHQLRNCVVHRNGKPTESLLEKHHSALLSESLGEWPVARAQAELSLPRVSSNLIDVRPRDAILFSDCCFKIASDINAQLRAALRPEGIVSMAAHHVFLCDSPLCCSRKFASPEASISWFLSKHFRVDRVNRSVLIAMLKNIGLWKQCRTRFAELAR